MPAPMSLHARQLAEQAEVIGDGLLEAAVMLMFEPTIENCDRLTAMSTGAITFARALRVALMKDLEAA